MSRGFNPLLGLLLASSGVVRGGLDSRVIRILAVSLSLDVLRLCLIELAVVSVGGQDSKIFPLRWVPVRIVISLLSALESVSVSVVVLSSVDSRLSSIVKISLLLSVSNEESKISVSGLAILVGLIALVHSVLEDWWVCVLVKSSSTIRAIRDGIGGGSISDETESISRGVSAHVLDDHVAE